MSGIKGLKRRAAGGPPKPAETSGVTDEPRAEDRDKEAGRDQQFNLRVAAWVKQRVKALAKRERGTLGEILEAMLAAHEAHGAGLRKERKHKGLSLGWRSRQEGEDR